MRTVRTTERTGKDGILRVSIPLDRPDQDFDVVVVVQPKEAAPSGTAEKSGWPAGYFELAGSIDDETFVRPPQGELPKPVDLG